MPGRVAFVPLRYGPQFAGGSEALTREIAMGLARRGWSVEILTTRVVDHLTWHNELPEGESREDGLTVRRFSAVPESSPVGRRAQDMIEAGIMPPRDEQWDWISWRFRLPDLYHHILRHGHGFDAIVFSPYMFWNAAVAMGAAPGNAVAMPCLHDEHYARLEVYRPVLAGARSVWFLAEPEHQLAHDLGPVADHHTVTGAGVHVPGSYDPEGFRRRYGIGRDFVLYAGRRERDKGWNWLVDCFGEAVTGGVDTVDLLTIGSGPVDVPRALAGRVRDLGFVSESDRNDAFAAALAYVQPSRMESFSRTVMEAWLAGTPVLAVEGSRVVGWHIDRSGGGAIFADGGQLGAHLAALSGDPRLGAEMAGKGRDYVLSEYSWPVVLDRMEEDLRSLARDRPEPAPPPTPDPASAVVVGSYPPVPRGAAAVTVGAVRAEWAAGREVTVVSPRKGAAHLTVPVSGPLAGRRLANVRTVTGARRLVLVVEEGFPLPEGRSLAQVPAAAALARAMGTFDHVRIVYAGPVDLHPRARALLEGVAAEVGHADAGVTTPGVTVLGPPSGPRRQEAARKAVRVARRGLGPAAPPVERAVRTARRAWRRLR